MAAFFKVVGQKTVYINPRLGKVDLSNDFTDDQALEWYQDINFPYIKPIKGAEKILSTLKVDSIRALLERATTDEEIEILKASKPESKKIQEFTVT